LTQPFFTTEQFTGLRGKLVSLADALDGCERILRDEFKDRRESALYMIGAISEAKADAKTDADAEAKVDAGDAKGDARAATLTAPPEVAHAS
ncbi:MAG: F0F1 ATP synthase subunit beta, partial [Burkholderiaceae bacterium]